MLAGEPKNQRPFTRLVKKIRRKPKPLPVTMYDSVTVSEIPKDAVAVAGYVNGWWPTYPVLVKDFPHAKHLSIAVSALHDAECLDVERGDATPDEAAAWVKRQLRRGIRKPVVYCSVSAAADVLAQLARGGVKRNQIRLWTAHYTYRPHRCTSACWRGFNTTADATQFTDRAQGRNLDASLCSPGFFS